MLLPILSNYHTIHNNTFTLIEGSSHTMYNTECKLVQNNRNTDLYVLFVFILYSLWRTVLPLTYQHSMSFKDTHTGSIVAQGGAVES